MKTNETDIKEKIDYCAGCVIKPCQVGCPLNNDITGFIKLLKENKKEEHATKSTRKATKKE